MGTGPPETGPLIAAIGAGEPLQLATADGGLPDVVLAQVGAAADGVIAGSGYLPASSTEGIVQELGAQLAEEYPGVSFDQFAKSGHVSVRIVAEAMQGSDEITPAFGDRRPLGHRRLRHRTRARRRPIDAARGSRGTNGSFGPYIYVYVANGGAYELSRPEPMDMTAALELLSEGQ